MHDDPRSPVPELVTLAERLRSVHLDRRSLLRHAGILGLASLSVSLLAACGDDDDDDPAAPAQPGTTPAPADDDDEDDEADDEDTPVTDDDDDDEDDVDEPDDAGRGGTLNVALNSDLTTMDPHMSTAAVDRQIYQNIYEKLVDINADLEIVPELAETWEISDEGDEYTMHLVDGVTFHDGEPVDAEAAKVNFDRMLDPDMGSPRRSEILQIENVEVVDDLTFRLDLSQAFSPLLATLSDRAGMLVSPAAIEELGEDLARQPVGAGAFEFVEWITDNRLVIRRNENYWRDGLPYLDEIIYRPITDAAVRFTSLRTNEVQLIDQISARDIEEARNDPDLVYSEVAGLAFTYIALNAQVEPFDDMALRQACAWCIDRDAINQVLFFGTGSPAQTPIPPSSWAYDDSVQVYEQDYDMARQKLEEGGMPDGFEFPMMVTNSPDAIQLAEAYQAQMAEAGIMVELELLEFGTLLGRLNDEDFVAVSLGWSGRPDPDGNIYGYFHSEGGLNRSGYSNSEVDRLLDETRAVTDLDERRALYSEATTIIAEEAPMIFIRFPGEIKVFQPTLQNYVHVPDGMMRLTEVWLDD
jgi:peptide/nickel transport system substrate-binding protein